MDSDERGAWNKIWSTMGESYSSPDDAMVEHVQGLEPGRALELGCGTGGNAIWLAEQGWEVTAVDYSEVAIDKGKRRAQSGASIEFIVADASTYNPDGLYDLVTSFYIQLRSEQRKKMLANAVGVLAPGGTLLFVSHDQASPPSGWSDEDLQTLTTAEQVISDMPGLKTEQAYVKKEERGTHAEGCEPVEHHGTGDVFGVHPDDSYESNSTVVSLRCRVWTRDPIHNGRRVLDRAIYMLKSWG